MLVTIATPISSHMKDKNSIFTARDEDVTFNKRYEILVFHMYLNNENNYLKKQCYNMGILRIENLQFMFTT